MKLSVVITEFNIHHYHSTFCVFSQSLFLTICPCAMYVEGKKSHDTTGCFDCCVSILIIHLKQQQQQLFSVCFCTEMMNINLHDKCHNTIVTDAQIHNLPLPKHTLLPLNYGKFRTADIIICVISPYFRGIPLFLINSPYLECQNFPIYLISPYLEFWISLSEIKNFLLCLFILSIWKEKSPYFAS